MTDPIKAALEAALDASITDAWTLEGEHRQWAIDRAASTVAAFLRALPGEFRAPVRFDSGNVDEVFFAEDWDFLAAAVDRAAKEPRDV